MVLSINVSLDTYKKLKHIAQFYNLTPLDVVEIATRSSANYVHGLILNGSLSKNKNENKE